MDAKITGNLGDILLREGLITEKQLERAERERQASGQSLARVLVEMEIISERVKLTILQKKLGVEIVNLKNFRIDTQLATRIPKGMAQKHGAIPVRVDPDGLLVAMDDPSDLDAVDRLSVIANMKIKTVLAAHEEIDRILEEYPEEVVKLPEAPKTTTRPLMRFVRGVTFWVLLLIPLVVFFIVLKYSDSAQRKIADMQLSIFDFALYLTLLWGTWSVIIYYFHDVLFSFLLGGGGEEDKERSGREGDL